MTKHVQIFFIAMCIMGFSATAQTSNAVLFTENGEQFTVILNGLRKNETPQTNVRLTGLTSAQYKLKIIFKDATIPELATNLFLEPGTERSFSVKKNAKGSYVLRMISEDAISDNSGPAPVPATPVTPATGEVQQTQVVQTTTTGGGEGGSINMGISINDNGVNINASGFDTDGDGHTQTTTVTTTTTTVHSSGSVSEPPPPPQVYLPGYNGAVGCAVPMAKNDFADLKNTISSKSFESTKLSIAKQVLKDHCLFASQVKEICALFTFEENKLDFAKYAYDYTYDVGNYFKINDVFTFETSTEELNEYIKGK